MKTTQHRELFRAFDHIVTGACLRNACNGRQKLTGHVLLVQWLIAAAELACMATTTNSRFSAAVPYASQAVLLSHFRLPALAWQRCLIQHS